MSEADAELDGIRREQVRLLATIEAMRKVQAMSPAQPPNGLSESELARRLVYDLITSLTRNEVVLLSASEAIIDHAEIQKRVADMRAAELDIQRREIRLREQDHENEIERGQKRWGAVARVGNAFSHWMWNIASHERTISAIIGSIVTIVGTLTVAATSGALNMGGCGP